MVSIARPAAGSATRLRRPRQQFTDLKEWLRDGIVGRLTQTPYDWDAKAYCGGVGRVGGVGRDLGMGVDRGVGVGRGVAVGVVVGVTVGVGVGVGVGVPLPAGA
jgi:hypothetical protein